MASSRVRAEMAFHFLDATFGINGHLAAPVKNDDELHELTPAEQRPWPAQRPGGRRVESATAWSSAAGRRKPNAGRVIHAAGYARRRLPAA